MSSTHSLKQGRRAARLLVAAVVVAAALLPATAASAAPVTFGSGELVWGVKESFRNYIVSPVAHGSYSAFDGATKLSEPTGAIRFDVLGGPYDDATKTGELLIDGTVHFTGHSGALDMKISNLRVVLAGGGGSLYADFATKENRPGASVEQFPNTELATLTVPDAAPVANGLTWSPVPATLTAAGASAFGSFYSAGESIDPLQPLTANYGAPRQRPSRGGGGGGGGGDGGGGGGTSPGGGTDKPANPSVKAAAKAVMVGRGRRASIATLRCGTARCAVKAPKSVKVKIGGKRYATKVLAPKALKAGRSGKVRVKLSKTARRALVGRRAKVKVKLTITAAGRKSIKTIRATIKAKKPAKG